MADDLRTVLRPYALAAAGAGFVLVWSTLGFSTALLAALAAAAASQAPRLVRRRQRPRLRAVRRIDGRPVSDELPLVPDEPSLVLSTGP